MDLKRLLFKLFLFCAVLMTGRSLFDCGMPARADLLPEPPEFRRVLILFPAEAGPRAQEEFMEGLAEVRDQHEAEYRELMRKWRETEPERKVRKQAELDRIAEQFGENWWEDIEDPDVFSMLPEEREMMYVHPSFLNETEVIPVRVENSFHSSVVLPDDEFRKLYEAKGRYSAVIVVASDEIAKSIANLLDGDYDIDFKTKNLNGELAVVFAGVSSFDEKLRIYTDTRDSERKELNSFAIVHPADPWPNVDLALRVFPNTKKIVLLASRMNWDEKKEAALRDMLGPGKTLKTVLLPDSVTPSDFVPGDYSQTMRQQYPSLAEVPGKEIEAFRAAVQAEAQPDTVIVSLSSFEWGIDPVEWLPADFDACPIFADTPPTRKNAVGGFCRSMKKLAVQVGDLLEELEKAPLEASRQNIPMTIPESDDLWINEAAQKRYRLDRLDDFQENMIVANTTTKKAPRMRVYPTWTKKRIFALLAANAAVLGGLALITLLSIRARRRRRNLAEKIYESLPVRVLVTDREGRIIDYHMQYGEMEQTIEIPWRNINSVPWLQDIDAGKAVREAFDTGRTIVREYEIDGERRVVVLSSTPSDVFGRAAVIAVSSDTPQNKSQA
jgi:PAS domain-containing protein